MKFFIPAASSDENAEFILSITCQFINSPVPERRVHMLRYTHNGKEYVAEVGRPIADYYNEGNQLVAAIIPGTVYKICLPDRGVLRGEPIYVGEDSIISVWHFD
jgi:hypothetical protein